MVNTDLGQHMESASETRQERRRRRTRESLYRSALQLFEEKGFDETTVHAIAEAADAGKGTFFHYFPTKDHVLVAYWNEFNARLLDAFDGIKKRTTRNRLLTAMEICGNAAQNEPEIGRVLLGRIFTSPALLESDQENEVRLAGWFETVLRDGIERGELRPDTDVESLQYLIIANMSSTFRDYIMSGSDDPVELLVRRTRLLLRTIEEPK